MENYINKEQNDQDFEIKGDQCLESSLAAKEHK